MPDEPLPPFEGLLEALLTGSRATLRSYRLAEMNAEAEARKDLREVIEEWVEHAALVRLAAWIEEHGAKIAALSGADLRTALLPGKSQTKPVPIGDGNGNAAARPRDHAVGHTGKRLEAVNR